MDFMNGIDQITPKYLIIYLEKIIEIYILQEYMRMMNFALSQNKHAITLKSYMTGNQLYYLRGI